MTKAPKKVEAVPADEPQVTEKEAALVAEEPKVGKVEARLAALEAYVKANVKALGWPEFEG